MQFDLAAPDRHHGGVAGAFGLVAARVDPAQILLLLVGQRQILQHDVARHVVEVELLARWRIGLAGMRQRQQLLGQAAGAAKLVDDGAQPLLGAHRIALAQGVLRLGQHDGQGRAQLVRRVGQELRLFVQHAAMTGNVVIDGLDQRRDLAGHPRGVQRRQVVGPAGADIVAQAHQRPQGPVHPHQTSKATSASMRVSRKTSWRCALASASTRLPMLSATTTNTWRCWLR